MGSDVGLGVWSKAPQVARLWDSGWSSDSGVVARVWVVKGLPRTRTLCGMPGDGISAVEPWGNYLE